MTQISRERISSFSILALGIFGAVFFMIHSLGIGDARGYSSLDEIDEQILQAEEQLTSLIEKRQWFESRIDLVSESTVDADLLGELARRDIGLYAPNEIVINLN